MIAKYPPDAYRGFRARLPDWLIGVPYARYLERAVRLLELREGDCVCDVACGPGYNLRRLVREVGPSGLVTAVEDNPHLLARAQAKVERAAWQNVRLLAELDPDRIERRPLVRSSAESASGQETRTAAQAADTFVSSFRLRGAGRSVVRRSGAQHESR